MNGLAQTLPFGIGYIIISMSENRLETMPATLDAIRAFIEKNPDVRVGQLIYFVCNGDSFNIENSELAKLIEDVA